MVNRARTYNTQQSPRPDWKRKPKWQGGRRRPDSRSRFRDDRQSSRTIFTQDIPHLKSLGRRGLATENMVPGQRVYGEDLLQIEGKEFRAWNPTRSKLAAAILKGMRITLRDDLKVLYLGVSSGTTASHLSDIVRHGMIFGVDFAHRVLREFLQLATTRANLVPILGNSNLPNEYEAIVPPNVDLLYQDVAQPNQAQILAKNAEKFLKIGGTAILMIKARSINVSRGPESVFQDELEKLKTGGFRIVETARLEPFERDHLAVVLEYRP